MQQRPGVRAALSECSGEFRKQAQARFFLAARLSDRCRGVGQIGDLGRRGLRQLRFPLARWAPLAGLDTIEEILHVVDGGLAEAVCLDDRIVLGRHALVIDRQSRCG